MNRKTWYFIRQFGLCCLQRTSKCHGAGGVMKSSSGASWEHVLPRSLKTPGYTALVMLACGPCNADKGSELPTLAQVELARQLSGEWFTFVGSPQLLESLDEDIRWYRAKLMLAAKEHAKLLAEIDDCLQQAAA